MSSIVQQLNSYVNRTMFGDSPITIHEARIVSDIPVLDLATNSTQLMQVLVVYVPHGSPQTLLPIHLGMPSLGPNTIFGEVTMGVALRLSADGQFCVYHSQQSPYEVAIKRSQVSTMLRRLRGGAANEENPLNEIASMELMHRLARDQEFGELFPHNMTLEMAATDGQSLFTILPRMKNCMELFDYCFSNVQTKQARRLLPFVARMQEVKMIMRAVLHAVAGLHGQHIAHRDLGLENALISVELLPRDGGMRLQDIKVIDYGMAVYHPPKPEVVSTESDASAFDSEPAFDDIEEEDMDVDLDMDEIDGATSHESTGRTSPTQRMFSTPFYGKKSYAPPECYYNRDNTTIDPRTADIWAMGCMTFMLAFDQQLWSAAHHELDPTHYGEYVHKDPVDGVRHLLYNRISRAMVLAEPLLIDLLVKMLQVDPSQRLTVDEALHHPWFTTA